MSSLICQLPEGEARTPDLLFVHGMSAGPWLWEDTLMPSFAKAGYRTWAIELSGRGDNRGDGWDEISLEQFSDELADALDYIGGPCVVVGHSLGGAVVQNLLRQGREVAGTVLLCSVPPHGMWRAAAEIMLFNPALWQSMIAYSLLGITFTDQAVMRRNLFPHGIDDRVFASFAGRTTDEPLRALQEVQGWRPIAPPPLSQSNVLVVGGAQDRLLPLTDLWLTAAYYGVLPRVLPQAGHMPMYPPSAGELEALILEWLPSVAPI